MKSSSVKAAEKPSLSSYGNCPHCAKNDGYMNVRWCHWFICKEHKVKWLPAMNLFAGWEEETEELWKDNAAVLEGYEEISLGVVNLGIEGQGMDKI